MKAPLLQLLALCAASSLSAEAVNIATKSAEIDQLIAADLAKQGQKANATASDEVFVRRVYLDVIGRVPTKKETTEFFDSTAPDKRAKLIDTLLDSDGYVLGQFNWWADLLRLQSTPVGGGQSSASGFGYAKWVKEALASNKPYDQMVRELITADGTSYENGATGFYVRDYNMALDNMAVTTQVFLGTSMVCAQCHNHPFDKWSQLDYYQMAAHTYGVEGTNNAIYDTDFYTALGTSSAAKKAKGKKLAPRTEAQRKLLGDYARGDLTRAMGEILRPLRYNHVISRSKDLRLPHDYAYENAKPKQAIEPTIPASFAKDGTIAKPGEDPTKAYAKWMTSKDNPRFTLTIANRLWKKFLGVGVFEPVDEITDSTVPSNPKLMAFLEQTMKDLNYDLKAYSRMIMNSQAYQAQAYSKDLELGEAYHFPGPLVRRLSAEQIWDSMVALYSATPDRPSVYHTQQGEATLRRIEWLDRAISALSTEELIEGAKAIADVQKKLANDVRQAQLDLQEANKNKDEAAIRKAKQTVAQQRKKIDEAAEDIVYTMGWKKFAELARDGKLKQQVDDPEFAAQIATVLKTKKNGENLTIDEALAAYDNLERAKARARAVTAEKATAERLHVDTKGEKTLFEYYEQQCRSQVVRAADIKSPAPNGHFLREFGQSDRDLVNNGSSDATVGQSLMMLNGRHFKNILNPYSILSRNLAAAKTPAQAIDTMYLTLLSRRATSEEQQILGDVLKDLEDKTQLQEALWAVINTREFLFVK